MARQQVTVRAPRCLCSTCLRSAPLSPGTRMCVGSLRDSSTKRCRHCPSTEAPMCLRLPSARQVLMDSCAGACRSSCRNGFGLFPRRRFRSIWRRLPTLFARSWRPIRSSAPAPPVGCDSGSRAGGDLALLLAVHSPLPLKRPLKRLPLSCACVCECFMYINRDTIGVAALRPPPLRGKRSHHGSQAHAAVRPHRLRTKDSFQWPRSASHTDLITAGTRAERPA